MTSCLWFCQDLWCLEAGGAGKTRQKTVLNLWLIVIQGISLGKKNTCIVKIQKELLILIPSILPSLFHRVSNIILQLKCNLISRLFDHSTFLSWWLHRESSRYIHSTFQMCSRKQPFLSSFFKTSSPAPKKLLQRHATFHFGGSPLGFTF